MVFSILCGFSQNPWPVSKHSIRLTDCHMSVHTKDDLYDSVPRSLQEFNQKLADWILIYDTYNHQVFMFVEKYFQTFIIELSMTIAFLLQMTRMRRALVTILHINQFYSLYVRTLLCVQIILTYRKRLIPFHAQIHHIITYVILSAFFCRIISLPVI